MICTGAGSCERLAAMTSPDIVVNPNLQGPNGISVRGKPTSSLIVAFSPRADADGLAPVDNADLQTRVQNALAAAPNLGWDFRQNAGPGHSVRVTELEQAELGSVIGCFPAGAVLRKIECKRTNHVWDPVIQRYFSHMFNNADMQVIRNMFAENFQLGFM